ncbi:autotransporter outer membrane beta-barrel domain-containing protein, partial [Methyloligella halotolerans]|uniref:autotransporter outer membrane beta-barrel domain-containing protein n=1 Tax=Methyloligella halotolerans TaxID=1177755 RepID=UPI000A6569E2
MNCLARWYCCVAFAASCTLPVAFAQAADGTWCPSPDVCTSDYNTAANWDPNTQVPDDTAFFGTSLTTSLTFSAITTVGGWTFLAGADDYDFSLDRRLVFNDAGISVVGGSATIDTIAGGDLRFINSSTAGSAIINNAESVTFNGDSTAGNATINNSNDLTFNNDSSAGSATINNLAGGVGNFSFNGNSTAGSATITNADFMNFESNSDAGSATIFNSSFLNFNGGSSAENANITNQVGGALAFLGLSTAGNANITNQAVLSFNLASTAGNASIINNNSLTFGTNATAGNASIVTNSSGVTDFSASAGPGNNGVLTAGSIAGAGRYYLGPNELGVGGNNLSTEVGGVISDCGATGSQCSFSGSTGGSLVKTGTGTLTLSGANTYTGGTTISGGTVQIGNGGTTGSIVGNVTNNSALVFNRSDDFGFAGAISGGGTLTQAGSGELTLSGVSSYSGSTFVNAGTLAVNGSIANSTVTVNGGALGGTGTVGSTTIMSGGTFAPGNSIGTLNVAGNVTFNSGSTYQVEVDAAGNSDLINASGTATLNGGTVEVLAQSGTYDGITTYTILTAGAGVNGTFNGVTSNLAFLTPSLTYDPNNVYLILTRNNVSFTGIANTPNQRAVAGALNDFSLDNALYLAVLNQTAAGARQAFDALSGEIHASVGGALLDEGRHVRDAVMGRLVQASYG